MDITQKIATELAVKNENIAAAISLLDEGATVPFIARYRKEMTGALDDGQLRFLSERLQYLRELEDRKQTILNTIANQEKLTPELAQAIENTDNKTALEDLYLPFKPKRRSKAQVAREAGLEPLAESLFSQQETAPETLANHYVKEDLDVKAALEGARAILLEKFAEDAELIGQLRERLWAVAHITAKVVAGQEEVGEKFKDYFSYSETLSTIPSHRALALLRGRDENVLMLSLKYQAEETQTLALSEFEDLIAQHFDVKSDWLLSVVRLAWRGKIFLSLETEALQRVKEEADKDAIAVFARNLKDLLLTAPAGRIATLGLDPAYRTGIKCAAIDDTGKLLATNVVYLHQEEQALQALEGLIKEHDIKLIAIGNGTASRETDLLVQTLLSRGISVQKLMISEAGASVYSASELAAKEFPNLDVTFRGAVSIARRLQDPLAELVKIEPKAIGVGQYQHDVNQVQLAKSLDAVVEDCVNAVGVEVNTASAPLLARVSGLNKTLAQNIVTYRDENGAFSNRKALLKVPRLGAKTFEQAAGFLRINNGSEILDSSAVHPEAYGVVEKIAKKQNTTTKELIGNSQLLKNIKPSDFVDERFGLPTILDILQELEKPARDPRGEFKTAIFNEKIKEINELSLGIVLEGVITNVTNFGAFVDIGVHQDGLIHISELSNNFVSNPHDIVKTGDVVKVRVLEIDEKRRRMALSMRFEQKKSVPKAPPKSQQPTTHTAMAEAFANLRKKS